MSYDKDTPLTINETLAVSQPKIKANFTEIETIISQDHETFDAAAGQGKHKQALFTQQTADISTGPTEMALYTKDNGGEPNIYVRKANDSTVYNLTPADSNHAVDGSEVLPSGLKMIWGSGVASFAGNTTTFTNGGFDTEVYSIVLTLIGWDSNPPIAYINISTKADFDVYCVDYAGNDPGGSTYFTYFAVGK